MHFTQILAKKAAEEKAAQLKQKEIRKKQKEYKKYVEEFSVYNFYFEDRKSEGGKNAGDRAERELKKFFEFNDKALLSDLFKKLISVYEKVFFESIFYGGYKNKKYQTLSKMILSLSRKADVPSSFWPRAR